MFQNFTDPDHENWEDTYYGPSGGKTKRINPRVDSFIVSNIIVLNLGMHFLTA